MKYVIDYDICALLLVAVTLFCCLGQKRYRDLQSAFFLTTLIATFIAAASDIATVLLMGAGPVWAGWVTNIICLLSGHLLPPLMLLYFLVVVGKFRGLSRLKKLLLSAPFLADALLVLTSPLTGLLFRITPEAEYVHGALYYYIYAACIFYIAASLFVVFRYRRRLMRTQFACSLAFMGLQIAAALLQIAFPGYLLVTLAACVSLVMMLFVFQTHGGYVDRISGAFNRNALFSFCSERYILGRRFALLAFALDNFQQVNGIYGTPGGDALIGKISAYLQEKYPDGTVVRTMGDRFIVLLPDYGGGSRELEAHMRSFPRVWNLDVFEIHITSCAVAMDSADYASAEELLTMLEYTVRTAKRCGPGTSMLVDGEALERLRTTSELEAAVERAVHSGGVEVWYQPIVDIPTGRVVAAEALARLRDDRLGRIQPGQFIPIVERSGSIMAFSEIVREKVCDFISRYDLDMVGIDHISVNLSVIECMETSLPERIAATTERYGVNSGRICFEITESTAAMSKEILKSNMDKLIERGFDFHLDDYGSGYSNIVSLLELPFSTVKIDRLILNSAKGAKEGLVERLISPFRYSGIKVVCEGIETPHQEAQARRWMVDYGQGYLFSKPLPEDEFARFVGLRETKKINSSEITKFV